MTIEEPASRTAVAGSSILKPMSNDADHDRHAGVTRQDSQSGHFHYHGHRSATFVSHDLDELTELRARQRTFEGAYQRTALGMAAYAIIVLKIFSQAFAAIGFCYVAMAGLLIIVSYLRNQRSKHDFADENMPVQLPSEDAAGAKPKRLWGRDFRTVGNLVILLVLCVGSLELAIFILLTRL